MKGESAVLYWEMAWWRQSFLTCMMYSGAPPRETTAINTSGLTKGGFCLQPLLGRLFFSPYPSWDQALDPPTKLHAHASLCLGCSQCCLCRRTFAHPYTMASGGKPDGFPQVLADGGNSHCPSESIRLRSCCLYSAPSSLPPSCSE